MKILDKIGDKVKFIDKIGDKMVDAIKAAIRLIKKVFIKIIDGVFDFLKHCVGWFKSLSLKQGKDIPFIADAKNFKDLIAQAPVKDCGIFEGVFDSETDEISANQYVEADKIDEKTHKMVDGEELVVLS